jgi:hypothetical protein
MLPSLQQSVRHHLSLNRLFERQPRPVTDPGFGSYWTVNLAAPPGTKRPRKRGRPNRDLHGDIDQLPTKRRGRPRRNSQQLPPIATLGSDRTLGDGQISSLRETYEEDDVDRSDEDCESEDDMNTTWRYFEQSQLRISQLIL